MPTLTVSAEGPKIHTERDATDIIGETFSSKCETVVIPVERLDEDFFRLRTGVAGAIVQKFVNYRRKLVIVGDISRWVEESTAFRDFVIEANRGTDIQFVDDVAQAVKPAEARVVSPVLETST